MHSPLPIDFTQPEDHFLGIRLLQKALTLPALAPNMVIASAPLFPYL